MEVVSNGEPEDERSNGDPAVGRFKPMPSTVSLEELLALAVLVQEVVQAGLEASSAQSVTNDE